MRKQPIYAAKLNPKPVTRSSRFANGYWKINSYPLIVNLCVSMRGQDQENRNTPLVTFLTLQLYRATFDNLRDKALRAPHEFIHITRIEEFLIDQTAAHTKRRCT